MKNSPSTEIDEVEMAEFERDFEAFVVMASEGLTYEQALAAIRTVDERN